MVILIARREASKGNSKGDIENPELSQSAEHSNAHIRSLVRPDDLPAYRHKTLLPV